MSIERAEFECPSTYLTDYRNAEYCASDIDDKICCSRKKEKFDGHLDKILTPCTADIYSAFLESRPENSTDYSVHVWQGNSSNIDEGEFCFRDPDDLLCCSGNKGYFKNTIKHRCRDMVNIPDGHLPPSFDNDFADDPAAWNQKTPVNTVEHCYCDVTHEQCCTANIDSFQSWVNKDLESTSSNTSFRCSSLLTTTADATSTTVSPVPNEAWAKPIPKNILIISSALYVLALALCCLSLKR
jgi:hypothetical protein